MAVAARKHRLTYAEYLALERETDLKHEFLDGEAWAMAGGTPRHSRVKANLITALNTALGDGSCVVYDSDLKVRVLETGLATYPDAAVVCGPLGRDPEDRNAVTNPAVLVEVLSDATEAWDRGGKFAHYRRIPSLRHYLLVDSGQPRVEHFVRQEDGRWLLSEHGPGDAVEITAAGVSLPVDGLYRGLPDEPEDAEAAGATEAASPRAGAPEADQEGV